MRYGRLLGGRPPGGAAQRFYEVHRGRAPFLRQYDRAPALRPVEALFERRRIRLAGDRAADDVEEGAGLAHRCGFRRRLAPARRGTGANGGCIIVAPPTDAPAARAAPAAPVNDLPSR